MNEQIGPPIPKEILQQFHSEQKTISYPLSISSERIKRTTKYKVTLSENGEDYPSFNTNRDFINYLKYIIVSTPDEPVHENTLVENLYGRNTPANRSKLSVLRRFANQKFRRYNIPYTIERTGEIKTNSSYKNPIGRNYRDAEYYLVRNTDIEPNQ